MDNQRSSISRKENEKYGSTEEEKGIGIPPIHNKYNQPLHNSTYQNSHLPTPMGVQQQSVKKKSGPQPISFPKIGMP